jgi:hypothetical protein
MATQKKVQQPWLMASALLGLSRLLPLMREHKLTFQEAEAELRGQAEDYLRVIKALDRKKYTALPGTIPWASFNLPNRDGNHALSIAAAEELKMKKRSPRLIALEAEGWVLRDSRKVAYKSLMPVPKELDNYRSLWSWLLDVRGEPGEKLRVALGNPKDIDRARKIMAQIEEDSKGILEALKILGGKMPCDSARWNGKPFKGERAKLLNSAVKLSLEVSTHKDTVECLRQEIERWQRKQREAETEIQAMSKALRDEEQSWKSRSSPGKTGRQKRS